jgi:hypothetical protein
LSHRPPSRKFGGLGRVRFNVISPVPNISTPISCHRIMVLDLRISINFQDDWLIWNPSQFTGIFSLVSYTGEKERQVTAHDYREVRSGISSLTSDEETSRIIHHLPQWQLCQLDHIKISNKRELSTPSDNRFLVL